MQRMLGKWMLAAVFLVFPHGALGETLVWDWPSEDADPWGACAVRTCGHDGESSWENLGQPCVQGAPGEKCVVDFEYMVSLRVGGAILCDGMVPAGHCGTYQQEISPCVDDLFFDDGTFNEAARWKYRVMVRSLGCDGTVSDWVSYLCGDEADCEDVAVGDVNADGILDRQDVIDLLSYLRFSDPPPACFHAADALANGVLHYLDALLIFLWLPPEEWWKE